jgi:hypothetical protein
MDELFHYLCNILFVLIFIPILVIIGVFAYGVMGWIGVIIFIGVCVYSFIQGFKEGNGANNKKNNYQNGADNDDYLYYHFTKED